MNKKQRELSIRYRKELPSGKIVNVRRPRKSRGDWVTKYKTFVFEGYFDGNGIWHPPFSDG